MAADFGGSGWFAWRPWTNWRMETL